MKILILATLFSMNALAAECLVDGISDGPQKLGCYIHDQSVIEKLYLKCSDGNYKILWKDKTYDVEMAYHEEVEEGSTPLVFSAEPLTLRATFHSLYYRAELTVNGRKIDGLCFD